MQNSGVIHVKSIIIYCFEHDINEFASPIEIGDPGRTSFNMTIWMVGLELSTTNRTLGKGLVSSCANPGRSSSCKRKSSRPEFTAGTRMSRLNSPFSRGEVLHTWSKSPKTTSNEPGGAGVSSSLNRTSRYTKRLSTTDECFISIIVVVICTVS